MEQSTGITLPLVPPLKPYPENQVCKTEPAADAIAGSPRPSLTKLPSPAISPPSDRTDSPPSDPQVPFFHNTPNPKIVAPHACRSLEQLSGGSPRFPVSFSADKQPDDQGGTDPYHLERDAFFMDFDACSDQIHPSPQVKSVDDPVVSEAVALLPGDDRDAAAADDSLSISVPYDKELWESVQQRVSDETDQVETYVAEKMLAHLGLPDDNFIGDKNMKEHFMRKLDIPGVPDVTILFDANGNSISIPQSTDNLANYLLEQSNLGNEVHIKCSQVCEVKPGTAESMILEKLEKSSAFLTWLMHEHPHVRCDSFEISIVHDVKAPGANLSHSGFISPLVINANSILHKLKSPDTYESLSDEDERLTPQKLELKNQFDQYRETVPTIIEEIQNLSEKFEIKAYELDQKGRDRYFEDHTVGARRSSPEIYLDMMRCMGKSAANGNFRPAPQEDNMDDSTLIFDYNEFWDDTPSQVTVGVDESILEGNDEDGGTIPDPDTLESPLSMSE